MKAETFIMPSKEEIERLKKKYGEILYLELEYKGLIYKAICRKITKNVIRGLDLDLDKCMRIIWDRVKLVYNEEFETNDELVTHALHKLIDANELLRTKQFKK